MWRFSCIGYVPSAFYYFHASILFSDFRQPTKARNIHQILLVSFLGLVYSFGLHCIILSKECFQNVNTRVSIDYDRVKEGRNHKNENITVDAKSICHGALLKYVLNRINIFKENVNTLRFLPNFQSGRLRTNMNQLEP